MPSESPSDEDVRAAAVIVKRQKRLDRFREQLADQEIPISDETIVNLLAGADQAIDLRPSTGRSRKKWGLK